MKIYVDSSALLRRYFREKESEEVVRLLQEPHIRMVSGLVFVELASVFRRALNGRRISPKEHRALTEAARKDLKHFRLLPAGEELFRQAALVADLTGLRSLDAIHLASARMAGADLVLTFDTEMASAAHGVGLKVKA
jgi:predicted nucleic acid-binding protein